MGNNPTTLVFVRLKESTADGARAGSAPFSIQGAQSNSIESDHEDIAKCSYFHSKRKRVAETLAWLSMLLTRCQRTPPEVGLESHKTPYRNLRIIVTAGAARPQLAAHYCDNQTLE